MLQSTVLTLSLLPNHNEINVVVSEPKTRLTLDANDVREQIQLEANLLVHGLELAALAQRRRRQHSLQADLVASEATHEVLDRTGSARHQLRGQDLLELDGSADELEDFSDAHHELWADAVAGHERDFYFVVKDGLR